MVKRKIKGEDMKIQRLYTTSQIAITYLMNKIAKSEKHKGLLEDVNNRIFPMTKYKKDVHSAYRGGRVECFKTGKFKDVNYIDCNNLYGYASMNIRFPDLRTEKKIWKPLGMMTQKELLKKIGLSRVMIVNKNNDIGLIPIRTDTGNYFPKRNKYIIGTYTHIELEEAIKEPAGIGTVTGGSGLWLVLLRCYIDFHSCWPSRRTWFLFLRAKKMQTRQRLRILKSYQLPARWGLVNGRTNTPRR